MIPAASPYGCKLAGVREWLAEHQRAAGVGGPDARHTLATNLHRRSPPRSESVVPWYPQPYGPLTLRSSDLQDPRLEENPFSLVTRWWRAMHPRRLILLATLLRQIGPSTSASIPAFEPLALARGPLQWGLSS